MFSAVFKVVFVAFLARLSITEAIKACNGYAKYTLTFKAEWTRESHADFPSGRAHFSELVGCSHNASYVMWTPGEKATPGVQSVAETGGTSTLEREMKAQEDLKNVYKKYTGIGIGSGTGTATIKNIEVNTEYPLVSFITMIAPSPDWFVGVHDWQLCDTTTGKWRESRVRDLPPYDSGTDSGPDFRSPNNRTVPPVDIHLITNKIAGSLKSDNPIPRFGTFTFTKTFDSNPSSGNTPTPTSTAVHPVANFSTSLVLTLCILNILKNIL